MNYMRKKWVCRSWPTHTVPTPVHTGHARKGTAMAINSGKLYAGVAMIYVRMYVVFYQ